MNSISTAERLVNRCNGNVLFIEAGIRQLPVSINIPEDQRVAAFTNPQEFPDEFLIQSLEEYENINRILSQILTRSRLSSLYVKKTIGFQTNQ